ncbi:hypothetical protein DQ04_01131030 [Trypanosoma grayi]|uniref:hypothetical protein n=1 Tax=Trypanosoma grayi TaxID=71804 RepID=UPI0004F4A409|nr:hypothetical protein DQ04_01131030 [Trypanosoma grayi]KEG13234.1 hypothetical protein DQ04_01131030 [Trypanosoma grayi]
MSMTKDAASRSGSYVRLSRAGSEVREERWGQDRLVLANQIHNLLVTIRSSGRFGAKARFLDAGYVAEHPLLLQLKALQRQVMTPTLVRHISEERILQPFCDLCSSSEMNETVVGVALTSLSNLIDLRCTFITKDGLKKVIFSTRTRKGELADSTTYEVVLARRLQLCVSCASHPSASALPERLYVDMVRRAYTLATHPGTSPLLRRTAEQAMKSIASSLYTFVVEHKRINTKLDDSGRMEEELGLSGTFMLRYICSLINGVDEEEDSTKSNPRSDTKGPSKVAVVQLEGLWLVQAMLFVVKDYLCEAGWEDLLYGVQHDLCRALLANGVNTENVIVLSQILRTVHIVVKTASMRVVPQTFSFIKALHLDPIMRITEDLRTGQTSPGNVASPRVAAAAVPPLPNGPALHLSASQVLELYERRELLLESLVEFCSDANFAAFCYAQYDLSRRFLPLLDRLCNVLVENCFYMSDRESPGGARKGERIGYAGDFGVEEALNQMDVLALEAINGLLRQTTLMIAQPGSPAPELTVFIEARLEEKKLLMEFASLFCSDAAKDGIPFLLREATRVPAGSPLLTGKGVGGVNTPALIIEEPAGGREVGACLFRLSDILDKRALGDYLGDLGREPAAPSPENTPDYAAALATWEAERAKDHLKAGTVRFYEEQLKGFLGGFNYRNKSLLSCIRETAYRMCMPGEAQKIDRVMEAFAKMWASSNHDVGKEINPFCSEQGPFILAFSLIMLNTDQHSGKMNKPMTQEDFRRVHRDSDGGNSLPEEYLNHLFDDVKLHPIIMAEMINAGFTNDVTWSLEMQEHGLPVGTVRRDAILGCSMQSTSSNNSELGFIQALHPFIFRAVWKYGLTVYSNTLESCRPLLEYDATEGEGYTNGDSSNSEATLSTAENACNSALDGLCHLARAAAHFGLASAVDRVILVILSQVPLDMKDPHGSLVRLGGQRFPLRCLEKLLHLLKECLPVVMDSWEALGHLFCKLFLLGMFAKDPKATPETTELWEELCGNPGIVVSGARRAQSEVGWFAALWVSSTSPERARAQESEERRAMDRVKAILPTIEEFLLMIDSLAERPHQQFTRALCDEGALKTRTTAKSYAASYTMILVTEVAVRRLGDSVVVDRYAKFCQQVTSSVFAVFEQPKYANSSSSSSSIGASKAHGPVDDDFSLVELGHPMSADAYTYWQLVAARVVGAVVRAIKHFACNALSRDVALQILSLLTTAPVKAFNAAVAPTLSSALMEFLVEPHYLTHIPPHGLLEGLLNALCVTITTCDNPLVQWRTRKAFAALVTRGLYDPLDDSESVVNALVACALEAPSVDAAISPSVPPPPAAAAATSTSSAVAASGLLPSELLQKGPLESFADMITLVCRRLAATHNKGAVYAVGTDWYRPWIASLRGLCGLVVLSRPYRDRSDALLCLQRCLLDSEIKHLPATAVAALYEDAIFPLTEQMCAPSSSSSSSRISPPQGAKPPSGVSVNTPAMQSFVTSLFSPLAPLPPSRRAVTSNNAVRAPGITKDARLVTIDLKCRIVGLLPKVFLHYMKSLSETPEILQELWQRILGTLYALYTAPTDGVLADAEGTTRDPKESAKTIGVAEDEAALREAIQETVKNMIYVLAATLGEVEGVQILRRTPYFWTSTKNLLRTFDFAEPLLVFIEGLES